MQRFFVRSCARALPGLVSVLALTAGLMPADQAAAIGITVPNGDFEIPDTYGLVYPAAFGAALEVPMWIKEGPEVFVPELGSNQRRDSGIFWNVAADPFPPVANASVPGGGILAFMDVNTDANTGNVERVSLSNITLGTFAAGMDYTFTLAIGPSVTSVALPGSTLVLSIGYFDPGDGSYVSLASSVVNANDNNASEDANEIKNRDTVFFDYQEGGSFDLLKDFSVTASDPVLSDAGALGKSVVIRVTQEGGAGGRFIMDSARLTAVPEPGSLALLGASAFALGLRGRR